MESPTEKKKQPVATAGVKSRKKEKVEHREEYAAAIESEIAALKSDLSSLVTQFASVQSLNYQDFVAIWQNMRMPEMIVIATGQRPNRELRMIMGDALVHAADIFAESVDQQTKHYGALYLMYSLYFVQPTIPKIKIRLTFDMWQKLKQLLEEAAESEQWDAVYIGGTLIESNAFHFVATLEPLNPEKTGSKAKSSLKTGLVSTPGASTSTSAVEKPAPTVDALLQRLSSDTNEFELAQSEYMQAKQALGTLRLPGLDRADVGIASDVMAKIRRLADA